MKRLFLMLSITVGLCTSSFAQIFEESDVVTEDDNTTTDYEADDRNTEDKYLDGVVEHDLYLEAGVMDYEPVRQADVPWEKRMWRVIDVRERINATFTYPGQPFIEILMDGAANNEIVAFRKDDFKDPITKNDIEAILFDVDTERVYDPVSQQEVLTVVKNVFDKNSVKRYRIKEIWFFDKEVSRMRNRILGIAPIQDKVSQETGEFLREEVLFWIYFPTARDYLSQFKAFNDENDVAPLSWADYIDDRRFSSFVYKTTNVRDNRIKDMYEDDELERLYESERIKNDLFNFEHDFWSY